jgi:FKBP-type peptidyl-prolyl cis-trans isomerase SlyD
MSLLIGQPKVYTIHYTLKDSDGEVIESSVGDDPFVVLTGSGQIIPGLEKELLRLSAGDKKSVTVVAAEAYGEYDEQMVVEVPREQFPSRKIEVGEQFQADAGGVPQIVVVRSVTDQAVTVDANHPLAGEDLTFDLEVMAIRDATKDEIDHGHVHGPGGIQH